MALSPRVSSDFCLIKLVMKLLVGSDGLNKPEAGAKEIIQPEKVLKI